MKGFTAKPPDANNMRAGTNGFAHKKTRRVYAAAFSVILARHWTERRAVPVFLFAVAVLAAQIDADVGRMCSADLRNLHADFGGMVEKNRS